MQYKLLNIANNWCSFAVFVISAPCVELADVCTAATLPSWGPLFSNCGESYDANRGICV